MKVLAEFFRKGQDTPDHVVEPDWRDREDVRWFASQANEWLRRAEGNSVRTTTISADKR